MPATGHCTAADAGTSVEEHASLTLALAPAPRSSQLALPEALGLPLATVPESPVSLPTFDHAAMDGYAVRSADLGSADSLPVWLPLAGVLPAGAHFNMPLRSGTTIRIMTGAPMPPGADTVVKREAVVEHPDGATFLRVVRPGDNLRRRGEDVERGARLAAAGRTLDAGTLALLTAAGITHVVACHRPRVLVVTSGAELAPPGPAAAPGTVADSNSPMLAAAVAAAGGEPRVLQRADDDPRRFLADLDEALSRHPVDLVLTAGGISAGDHEVVRNALAPLGVRFGPVAVRPGRPQGAGRYAGVPVIALPGTPVAAFVSFEVFARPAIRAAAGHTMLTRRTALVRTATTRRPRPGIREFRRGWLPPDALTEGGPAAVWSEQSHRLGAFATTNCLLDVSRPGAFADGMLTAIAWLLD